jgi:hypothetical protein
MPSNTPAPLAISSSARPSRDIRGQVERMNRTIKASHPTSSFAKHGLHNSSASPSIRSIKCRD